MRNVVIGFLGNRLDHRGFGRSRWYRWRPSLSLLMHHELKVDEMVLIYHQADEKLLNFVQRDAEMISPKLKFSSYVVDQDDAWDFEQVYSDLHDFALSYPFDPQHNRYYFHITTGTHVAQICIYLLIEANYFPGVLVQTSPDPSGSHGSYRIIDLDLSRYDQIASRFHREAQQGIHYLKSGIDTKNTEYNRIIEEIEHVAIRSTSPILLMGATGVGKSHLATKIYELKHQRNQLQGRLVEVNCATLRGDNAMSTLFGHIKGAYTGATANRKGLLKEADGGLLFLDEIGELGLDEQAMLLRAIEDKRFTPFGSDQEISSDFQLIAGTNQDLFVAVEQGRFREDLLARINLWSYQLPSLKQRIDDFSANVDYELQRFAQQQNRKISFNHAARHKYLQFAETPQAIWKANFRDLNASITRMAILAEGGRITEQIVDTEIQRLLRHWHTTRSATPSYTQVLEDVLIDNEIQSLDAFDAVQLAHVIGVCRNSSSLADAGRKLFAQSRLKSNASNDSQRLRLYLKKFGLDFKQIQ